MAEYPGGGGGRTATKKKKSGQNPNASLFRLAARLQAFSKDPYAVTERGGIQRTKFDPAKLNRALAEALKDYSPDQVAAVAREAKLSNRATQLLRDAAGDLPKANAIYSVLDILNRPNQAVLGLASEGPGGAARGFTGKEVYTPIQTALRVTGKSEAEAAQAEANLPGAVRFTGNLAGSIVTDPLTYLTFGSTPAARAAARTVAQRIAGETASKAIVSAPAREVYERLVTQGVKGLSQTERAVLKTASRHIQRKIAGVQGGVKVAGRTIPGTGGIGSHLGPKGAGFASRVERTVVPRAGARQAERAGELVPGTREEIANMLARLRGATKQGELRELQARKVGLTKTPLHHVQAFTEAEQRRIFDAMDVGGDIAKLPPKLREAAEKLKTIQAKDFESLQTTGRLLPEDVAESSVRQANYIPRYLSPEARAAKRTDEFQAAMRGIQGRDPGFLRRRTSEGPASSILTETGQQKYLLDPFEAVGRHARTSTMDAVRVREVEALSKLTDSAGQPLVIADPEVIGRLADTDLADEWTRIKAPVKSIDEATNLPRTRAQDILVRKEIAKDVTNVFKFMQGADEGILDTLSKINSMWAKMATANPGFIARNVVQGNIWAGVILAEARDPRDWARSLFTMERMMRGIRQTGDPLLLLKGRDRQLVQEALDEFAVGSGFISSLQDMAGHAGPSTASKVGRVAAKPVNAIASVNRFAEEWGHLAVFMAKRRQGYNAPEAAGLVRKYLLDYSDLSSFDRTVRYVNPFFTWTRKNTPLIMATALKNPGKLSKFQHLMDGIAAESEQQGLVPQWMREGGGIPVGDNKMFLPDFPQYSAADTLQWTVHLKRALEGEPGAEIDAARSFINAIGFGGVAGLGKAAGEIALGREFYSGRPILPGQQVPTPAYLSWIPGLDKTIPATTQRIIESAIPLAQRERLIAPKTEADKAAAARRLLSALIGVTLFPVGESQQKSEAYRRLDQLRALQRMLEGKDYKLPDQAPSRSGGGGAGRYPSG